MRMEELRELMRLERRLLREWERLKLLESALETCTARINLVPNAQGFSDKIFALTALKIEQEKKFDGLVFAKQMCQEEFVKIISEKISDKKIRRVILSRYSGGESIAEIAQVMGLSVKEVQKMHRAGLRMLRVDKD